MEEPMIDDDSSQNSLDQLVARIDRLEDLLRAQTTRLQHIEQYLAARPPASPRHTPPDATTTTTNSLPHSPNAHPPGYAPGQTTMPPPPPTGTPAQPTTGAQAGGATGATTAGATGAAGAAGSATRASGARAQDAATGAHASRAGAAGSQGLLNFEKFVGGRVTAWVGIIAACFAVAFFLREAFERAWIGPTGRVLLGAAGGAGVLALGERLRQKGLRQYAYILSGGGILILYLSVYAAYGFYQLINQGLAFLLMIAVTATAVLLAARHDALPIGVLGLVGGFLTPILLSTGRDNEVGLFSYIALLDAGVLALAYLKRWRSLYYTSFVATLLMILGWTTVHYQTGKLWPTIFFLSLFFLLFSLLAIVHNVIPRRRAQWLDITLIISNATFYFGMSYGMLDEANYDAALGSFALVVSAFYVLLYYAAWSRHRDDRLLAYSLLGAAITFFTIAIAIQLDQQWVTIGWAAEAVVLTWIGLRSQMDAPRHASVVVFLIAVTHWLGVDLDNFTFGADGATFVPLLNARAASCASLVAACAIIVWLYRRASAPAGGVAADERSWLTTMFVLAGNMLAFMLLTLDVNDYFEQQRMLMRGQPTDAGTWGRMENTRQFALTMLWTFYSTTALVLAIVRRLKPLRIIALVLLACTIMKMLVLDIGFYDAAWHAPLFNQTFAAFLLMVIALAVVVSFYTRETARIDAAERDIVLPLMMVVANVLALVALSAEASGYFERRMAIPAVETRDLQLAQQLSLSIIWMAYGAGMLAFGHLRRQSRVRIMALVLLGVTTLKVFFWDLSSLDRIYRIISFIVLGLILLAISYLYQKSQQREAEMDAEAEAGNV